jgi:cell fate regulator YaaT (PSP1 superfamily)
MEDKTQDTRQPANTFLSRGCCHAPQIYHDNSTIAEHRCCKLDAYDWLKDIEPPEGQQPFDCIEVRFKNSRKDFFRMPPDLPALKAGDIVAVEASPGHDIGIVALTGEVVRLQMRNKNADPSSDQIKKVYRRARLLDIEKWLNAVDLEERSKIKTRIIARDLGLAMKINDVEYQGDETKAVFYYTAEERVDFRELIKLLADAFKVRIEMRQIGARQESARVGGIGSCGRELCCATWLTDFTSVTTTTARTQQLSPNPQKLAGQCGKLKCCLNYENDVYLDALKDFPNSNITLKTEKGDASHQKTDVFKRIMWYAYTGDYNNMMALSVDRVHEIIEANRSGKLPKQLEDVALTHEIKTDFGNGGLTEEDISRFDKMDDPESEKRRKRKKSRRKIGTPNQAPAQARDRDRDKDGQKQQAQQRRNDSQNKRPSGDQRSSSQRNQGSGERQKGSDAQNRARKNDNRPRRPNRPNRPNRPDKNNDGPKPAE